MNRMIRTAIQNYITVNGPTDSRVLITLIANHFSTSKKELVEIFLI